MLLIYIDIKNLNLIKGQYLYTAISYHHGDVVFGARDLFL